MHDHNLDDLILDAKPSTTSRAKNILSLLALFIVVLIAGIVLYKIFLTDQHRPLPDTETNLTQYVSPDLQPEQTEKNPLALNKDEEDDEAFITIPPAPVTPQKRHDTPSNQTETQPAASLPKTASITPKTPKRHDVHEKKAKPNAKPASKPTPKPVTVPKVRYYVQVGSFSKPPQNDSRLLQAIRNNGYRYTVYKAPNGMRKILIGPYSTRAQADKAIGRIKSRINKHAFVFTMK